MRAKAAVCAVAVVAAAMLSSCAPGDDRMRVAAEFERAVGLYPGSPVRLQGIDVGEITDIRNERGIVKVTMRVERDAALPADAKAVIVPLSLLGERYVQLGPVRRSGPRLEDGAVIPVERTAVPAEIDELLAGFEGFLDDVRPQTVSAVVHNLAELLDGQGQQLNELLGDAAATVQLLADESDELRAITSSLATLTTTLESRTSAITSLIRNYELVAGALAERRDDVEGTVVELARASRELASLLLDHRDPLKADVEVLTTVGRTLQRNIDRLDTVLVSTVRLFEAAGRAYDRERNWLPLNNQAPPGQSSDAMTTAVRDRLAGVCRRLAARLGDAAPGDLRTCGDPHSGYFDSILGQVTEVLGGPSGDDQAAELFARGLQTLPPLTPEQRQHLSATTVAPSTPSTGPTTTTARMVAPLPPPPARTSAPGGGLLDKLLGMFGW